MYATLNELLFPAFLFSVYFCAVSTLTYPSQNRLIANLPIPQTPSHSNSIASVNDRLFDQHSLIESTEEASFMVENESLFLEPVIPEIQKEEVFEPQLNNDLHPQTETIINRLNKRQARQICKPLGIQQKSGKVEKSLTSVKAEIRSLFKDDSEKVIAVIQEKLPELICLPTETNEKSEKIAI